MEHHDDVGDERLVRVRVRVRVRVTAKARVRVTARARVRVTARARARVRVRRAPGWQAATAGHSSPRRVVFRGRLG